MLGMSCTSEGTNDDCLDIDATVSHLYNNPAAFLHLGHLDAPRSFQTQHIKQPGVQQAQ